MYFNIQQPNRPISNQPNVRINKSDKRSCLVVNKLSPLKTGEVSRIILNHQLNKYIPHSE